MKLIDFGASIFLENDQHLKTQAGTPSYMAPEIVTRAYSHEIDVWSCGVMLYRLLSGKLPFTGARSILYEKICKAPVEFKLPVWETISPSCQNLIKKMLEKNPRKRIPIEHCLTHPWTKTVCYMRNIKEEEAIIDRLTRFKVNDSLSEVYQLPSSNRQYLHRFSNHEKS